MTNFPKNPKSNNFEDRTGSPGRGLMYDFLDRLLGSFGIAPEGRFTPQQNDLYYERLQNQIKNDPTNYLNMTVKDFTPEEWKRIKEDGFSFQDIMVMREYNRTKNKNRFREEEDGSISRK